MEKTEPIDLERIRDQDNEYIRKYLYNKRNHTICTSYVKRNSGSQDDAEDVFSEAVSVFWENVANGRLTTLTSSVSTYLYGITQRIWLKRLKTSGRMIRSEETELEVAASMVALKLQVPGEEDCEEAMQKALDALRQDNESHYQVIMSFYFEQKSMDEIAAQVGMKSGDVAKSTRYRAMQKLAALFKKMNINREDCL